MLIPVILSGGSGTRLWPLSRELYPKQLLPLVGERTMLQETAHRVEGLEEVGAPIVVCNESHRFMVAEQLREEGVRPQAIVLEPMGRNTAPAVAVAALVALQAPGGDGEDPLLLVLPADHVIGDAAIFRKAVDEGRPAASAGKLVTFGVVPNRPETPPTRVGWRSATSSSPTTPGIPTSTWCRSAAGSRSVRTVGVGAGWMPIRSVGSANRSMWVRPPTWRLLIWSLS